MRSAATAEMSEIRIFAERLIASFPYQMATNVMKDAFNSSKCQWNRHSNRRSFLRFSWRCGRFFSLLTPSLIHTHTQIRRYYVGLIVNLNLIETLFQTYSPVIHQNVCNSGMVYAIGGSHEWCTVWVKGKKEVCQIVLNMSFRDVVESC